MAAARRNNRRKTWPPTDKGRDAISRGKEERNRLTGVTSVIRLERGAKNFFILRRMELPCMAVSFAAGKVI